MKSIETLSNGLVTSGRGSNNLAGSWWSTLYCWNTRQVRMYASMSSLMCGQKYEAWTSAVVHSIPVCPTYLELWHSLMTSFRKFLNLGTKNRSPLVRRMPSSCQNRLVLPLSTFFNKSFARGSYWRPSLMRKTRSDFGWLMLSVVNSAIRLRMSATILALPGLYSIR